MMRWQFLAALSVAAMSSPAAAQNWWSQYRVGDQVMFSVSGREADFQPCIVAEADPDYGIRVRCNAFKHWPASTFIVYGEGDVRKSGGDTAAVSQAQTPVSAPPRGQAQTPQEGRTPVGGNNWWSGYAVGDRVMFTISERASDVQPCTVVEADPDYGLRVQCQAFKHWAAGKYIVYHQNNIGGAPAQNVAARAAPPATQTPPRPNPPAGTGPLKPGEYACYGIGGTLLVGLGFKLAANGSYTDLEGRNPGRVSAGGGSVTFTGGTLGGRTARRLDGNRFAFGQATTCEPW
jgi:hypothetical protein